MCARALWLLLFLVIAGTAAAQTAAVPDWTHPLPGPDWQPPYDLAYSGGFTVSDDGQAIELLVPDVRFLQRIRRANDGAPLEYEVQTGAEVPSSPRVISRDAGLLLAEGPRWSEFPPMDSCSLQFQRPDLSFQWRWQSGLLPAGSAHCHHVVALPEQRGVVTASPTRVLLLDATEGKPVWQSELSQFGGPLSFLQKLETLSANRILLIGVTNQEFGLILDAGTGQLIARIGPPEVPLATYLATRRLSTGGTEILARTGVAGQLVLLKFDSAGQFQNAQSMVIPDFTVDGALPHGRGFILSDRTRQLVLRLDGNTERWRTEVPGGELWPAEVSAGADIVVASGADARRLTADGQLQPALVLPDPSLYIKEVRLAANGRLWVMAFRYGDFGEYIYGDVRMAAYEPGSTEPSTTFRVTLPRPPHRLAFDAALDGRVRHLSALQSQHSQLDDGRLVGTTLSPAGRVLQHFQLPWRVDDATLGFALQAGWLVLGPDPNRSDRRLVALDPAGQMLWARTLPGHFARLACNRGQRCVLDPGVAGQPLELLDFSGAVLATQAEIPPGQLLAATDGVGLQALFANQGPTTLMSLDPLPAQLLAQVPGNGRPLGTGLLESNGSTLRWVQGTSATWSRLLPGPLNGLSTLSPGRLHVVTGDWGGPLTLSTLDALTGNVRRSIALPANFPHVGTVTAASDDLDWLAAYDGELGFRELLAIDDGGIRQHLRTAGSISAMQALPAGGVVVETQPLATAQLSAGRLERHSLPLLADGFEGVD